MSFKSKHGITLLSKKGKTINNISISYDVNDKGEKIPVILFIPYLHDSEHHHIELNNREAQKLQKWLSDFLDSEK